MNIEDETLAKVGDAKERPLLFSAPMVRAVRAGSKTQTRRVIKPVKFVPHYGSAVGRVGGAWIYGSPAALGLRDSGDWWQTVLEGKTLKTMCMPEAYGWGAGSGCPHGVIGDRLWVREAFSGVRGFCDGAPSTWPTNEPTWYWADGNPKVGDWTKPKPSIHMPRALSRITLAVVDVRVERLQDISVADAIAEGIEERPGHDTCRWRIYGPPDTFSSDPIASYESLWNEINGPGSWDVDPWVWVVGFKVLE